MARPIEALKDHMAEDPFAYCADQIRRYDHDRYLCALFAPTSDQRRLFALFAFNLEVARVREVVSEPVIGQMRLQWWSEAVAEFASGKVRAHPVAQALARAMEGRAVRTELLERLLTAREFDLADEPPADMGTLEGYATETSAALLEAALELLGVREAAADEAARHVGIAWALVGLLRAVPFHANQRRLYLPADLLARAHVDRETLFQGRAGDALRQVAREVGERATDHLARARTRRSQVPAAARPVLLLARLADRYVKQLERVRYDVFAPALQQPSTGNALRLTLAALSRRF